MEEVGWWMMMMVVVIAVVVESISFKVIADDDLYNILGSGLVLLQGYYYY